MIQVEYFMTREDGVVLNRTYSDAVLFIVQNETGTEYSEAVDVEGAPYTYSETDKPLPAEDEATEEDYINALNELGVHTDEESNA